MEAAPAAARSFYRRPLPASCVAFGSAAGRALFLEALRCGCADGYWRLAETFHTQSEPAFCGLASLAMTLNALAVDPERVWKGAWRWFDESLLDCCVPLSEVAATGITLDALACLARCNGAAVAARRAPADAAGEAAPPASEAAALPEDAPAGTGDAGSLLPEADLAEFEADVRAACEAGGGTPRHVLLASYSRAALGQTGGGHFSPLAAYAPESRMVLILDVARFKYPPHWVALDALWAAMRRPDAATGLPRGYLRLSAARGAGAAPPGALLTFSRRGRGAACCATASAADLWVAFLRSPALADALAATPGELPADALAAAVARVRAAAAALPPVTSAVEMYVPMCGGAETARAAVLASTRALPLCAALGGDEALTLLLLAAPPEAWARAAPAVRDAATLPPGAAAADEVAHLRAQLEALVPPSCGCAEPRDATQRTSC